MPSLPHELLVDMMREHPQVVLDLSREVVATLFPGELEVTATAATLRELTPPEYRADLVLVGRRPGNSRPRAAMVVEIQLAKDHDKRFSWPLYMAGLRARLRCPVAVVVITLDRRVERWARRPIALDRLGSRMTPVVIGPDAVPHVVDPRRATADPELALLSPLAHADAPDGRAIGYAVLRACDALDEARARLYTDLVFAYLGDAARRELEATMDIEKYEFQSDFMKRLAARAKAEGHALGHAEGHAEGQAEGEVRGRGQAVLDVLDARAIAVPDAARAVILGCVDPERLRAWLIAAVTATAIDELGVEL